MTFPHLKLANNQFNSLYISVQKLCNTNTGKLKRGHKKCNNARQVPEAEKLFSKCYDMEPRVEQREHGPLIEMKLYNFKYLIYSFHFTFFSVGAANDIQTMQSILTSFTRPTLFIQVVFQINY